MRRKSWKSIIYIMKYMVHHSEKKTFFAQLFALHRSSLGVRVKVRMEKMWRRKRSNRRHWWSFATTCDRRKMIISHWREWKKTFFRASQNLIVCVVNEMDWAHGKCMSSEWQRQRNREQNNDNVAYQKYEISNKKKLFNIWLYCIQTMTFRRSIHSTLTSFFDETRKKRK